LNRPYKLVALFGALLMAHSAFSMIQFRHFLKGAQDVSTSTPVDIVIECLGGLLLLIWSGTHLAGQFKSLLAAPDFASKSYDQLTFREDFVRFNTRESEVQKLRKLGTKYVSS